MTWLFAFRLRHIERKQPWWGIDVEVHRSKIATVERNNRFSTMSLGLCHHDRINETEIKVGVGSN